MTDAASNHDRCEAIAEKLCDALIQIQTTHPDWVRAKYRHHSFADNRSKIRQKFLTLLQSSPTAKTALDQVTNLLTQLLELIVSETQFYQQVHHLIATELSTAIIPLHPSTPMANTRASADRQRDVPQPESNAQAIAILLLDAENLDLSQAAEAWLETHCKYPLSLKFAFGNWKTLGKRDAELHNRGYQLLHVPKGKNNADDKMTIIGASVLVHLPTIKEAIVCSNDNGLETLRHTLRFQGLLDVSLLQRHQHTLKLINCKTKQSTSLTLPHPNQMPAVEQGIQYCQTYLTAAAEPKISLSHLSLAFSKSLGFPIKDFVKHHKLAKTPKDFFHKSPQFKITASKNNQQWYVSNCAQPSSAATKKSDIAGTQQREFTISSLQSVCVGIAKHLSQPSTDGEILIGTLAATFCQQHGQAMTAVLKKLEQKHNVPQFLQTCKGLKVYQKNQQWMVALAK